MTKIFETPQQFADEYLRVLTAEVGKDLAGCTNTERYQALAKLIAQKANQQFAQSDSENAKSDKKKVYYFSLEFLLGPLLDNYLLNYGIRDVVTEGLDSMGIKLDDVLAEEGDPAWAMAVWAALPHVSSTLWPPRASWALATVCATATDSSVKKSKAGAR